MAHKPALTERLERERLHARHIIAHSEHNWGWHTPAGKIRWQRRLDYLLQAAPKEAKVLEIGCGSGTFTAGLAQHFTHLTAIDIAEDLLAQARSKAPGVTFQRMDAHHLEFPDQCFDAIIGCSVLHHLDWDTALRNFYPKLKTGGIIRFSEPNLLNPQIFLQKNIPFLKAWAGDSPDEYAFTARQIRHALQQAGFERITVTAYEFLHPSTPPAWINRLIWLENGLSRTPLRHLGGSLLLEARKTPITPSIQDT